MAIQRRCITEILYFSKPGKINTEDVCLAVRKRNRELNIKNIVVASNTGETALKLHSVLRDSSVDIISVTEHAGMGGGDKVYLTPSKRKELEKKGIKVLMCSHALSGVGRSISDKFGGITHVEIIAYTLRLFSQGMKVCVEISIMAADAGLIPTTQDIIAIGGSGRGADTAVVLKPAHMNNFFDLKIKEIIAMPR